MAKITIELSDEALALLAERARRRKRTTEDYGTLVMQQSLVFGDRDGLDELFYLHHTFFALSFNLKLLLEKLDKTFEPELLNYLRMCEQLIELTKNALSISFETRKIQSVFDLQRDEFSLRIALNKVLRISHGSTYKKQTHELIFDIDPSSPENITADQDKFEQILHNLIGNALKFSPDGGQVKLSVRLSSPDTVQFTVSDQGLGMSARFLPHLGEKFARDEAHEISGSGIGLFLVKHFVEWHGGKLWAHSGGIGKGSTVHFTLPCRPKMERDPEFKSVVSELRRWRITLSALLAEVEALPRTRYHFDATARADFAQLVHTELEQMQAFLVQLEKDHATDHD